MRGVKQKSQPMALSEINKCIHVARPSPQMHPDDAAGAGGNEFLGLPWIDVVCCSIYVAEYGSDPHPPESMCSGCESKLRNDNLAGETYGFRQDFKAYRGVTNSDAMFDADQFANVLLELLQTRSVIGEPSSIQDIVNSVEKRAAFSNVGPTNMQLVRKNRWDAENSELFDVRLHAMPANVGLRRVLETGVVGISYTIDIHQGSYR